MLVQVEGSSHYEMRKSRSYTTQEVAEVLMLPHFSQLFFHKSFLPIRFSFSYFLGWGLRHFLQIFCPQLCCVQFWKKFLHPFYNFSIFNSPLGSGDALILLHEMDVGDIILHHFLSHQRELSLQPLDLLHVMLYLSLQKLIGVPEPRELQVSLLQSFGHQLLMIV